MRATQLCTNVRVLGIESSVRYFFDIVGNLGFCDIVTFPSRHDTLILQSCYLCFQE